MGYQNGPYVYGEIDDEYDDAPAADDVADVSGEAVIIDGEVMSYRRYRHRRGG